MDDLRHWIGLSIFIKIYTEFVNFCAFKFFGTFKNLINNQFLNLANENSKECRVLLILLVAAKPNKWKNDMMKIYAT